MFLLPAPMVYGAGSASVLLACVVYGPELPWFRILDMSWLRVVGRVSYSFYLIHLMILYSMARGVALLPERWTAPLLLLALNMLLAVFSCVAAVGLAKFLFLRIESPFMVLGKQISGWLIRGTASWHPSRSEREAA